VPAASRDGLPLRERTDPGPVGDDTTDIDSSSDEVKEGRRAAISPAWPTKEQKKKEKVPPPKQRSGRQIIPCNVAREERKPRTVVLSLEERGNAVASGSSVSLRRY